MAIFLEYSRLDQADQIWNWSDAFLSVNHVKALKGCRKQTWSFKNGYNYNYDKNIHVDDLASPVMPHRINEDW